MLDTNQPDSSLNPVSGERFRPGYHYTPRRNWLNDPNGLVWFAGEYHLFYQYNPYGLDWGHMSWGHAVSTDLLHWQELPVAIPEDQAMIFSGSAIIDHDNVSGLGDGNAPPMLAYYTEHFPEPGRSERQSLAYSHDRGRTFKQYAGNPLIDIGYADFRDPKVFYHAQSHAWILIVALSQDRCIHVYRSADLLVWEHASTFGPTGSTAGQWECADLLFCHTEDVNAEGYWVLKVDVDDGIVGGGSGSQYFVGQFDGHCFTVADGCGCEAGLIVDYGPDFYASASWSNLPEGHVEPVLLGWMSNQQSGRYYPTSPWRGTMSIPRSLYLFEERGLLRLGQRPIANLMTLRGSPITIANRTLKSGESATIASGLQSVELMIDLLLPEDSIAQVCIMDECHELISITLNRDAGTISFARYQASIDEQVPFARASQSEMIDEGRQSLHVFLDHSTIEIFLNDGRRVYSACVFAEGDMNFSLTCRKGEARSSAGLCWPMATSQSDA